MNLGSIFGGAKDRAMSLGGKQVLGAWLAPYGDMLNFSIDSTAKKVTAEILLKGEADPIKLTLGGYEILTDSAGVSRIKVRSATASREWMAVLLNEFVAGKSVEVPAKFASIVKMLA